MKPVVVVLAALVGFLLAGNLAILGAAAWAGETAPNRPAPEVDGVAKLNVVTPGLWRGAAPTDAGYRNLADAGVTTVVDLRAESESAADAGYARDLGMDVVRIPIRDGQIPSSEDVSRFLTTTRAAAGTVFVHCGAGVGRTGAMVGAYLVGQGDLGGAAAVRRNLAIGPPSLEQIAFVANLEQGDVSRPSPLVTAVSRVLDAPRRIWSRLG